MGQASHLSNRAMSAPSAGSDPAQTLPGQCFEVGGCVRDGLLRRPITDRDWVVVGCTPEDMVRAGFTPVGRDFPVFLHPHTREEYALARTERKSGVGYRGFTFHTSADVTLQEDLLRRDLTINAMARSAHGEIIDPFGGQRDLQAGVLRHVSAAFAEDPVRLLRTARFAARFPEFRVAPDTMALMHELVRSGEVDALVAERVWQEISRGLMESHPSRMLTVLRECGALVRLLPEVDRLFGVPQPAEHHPEIDTGIHLLMVLDAAAASGAPLPVRYACLVHDLGKGTTPVQQWPRHIGHEQRSVRLAAAVAQRWKVPIDCQEVAQVVAQEHGNIHRCTGLGAVATVRLLHRCDAFRRPQRFEWVLWACECDFNGRAGFQGRPYPSRERLWRALGLLRNLDLNAVVNIAQSQGLSGPAIGQAVDSARAQALRDAGFDEPASEAPR